MAFQRDLERAVAGLCSGLFEAVRSRPLERRPPASDVAPEPTKDVSERRARKRDASRSTDARSHRLRRLESLKRAVDWEIQLETGQVPSRAAIARREGVSRAAVTLALRTLDAALANGSRPSNKVKRGSEGRDFIADAIARWEKAGYRHLRKDLLGRFEHEFISHLLRLSDNNISKAAAMAKIDRKHFWRLMERNGIARRRPR